MLNRGLAPVNEDDQPINKGASSRISKFGVGAIQSGFYIGSSITVVSRKNAIDDPNDLNDVLEFTMDEDQFKNSSNEGSSIFKGNIIKRAPYRNQEVLNGREVSDQNATDSNLTPLWKLAVDCKMEQNRNELTMNDLSQDDDALPSSGGGFTYVAMRLREEHEQYFYQKSGSFDYLCRQLSHTYHYYLHPHSTDVGDDQQLQLSQFNHRNNSAGNSKISKQHVDIEVSSKGHATGLDKGVMVNTRENEVFKLNDLKGMEHYYQVNAAKTFPFSMLLEHKDDKNNEMKHKIHGEIRYYPHNGSRETMPILSDQFEAVLDQNEEDGLDNDDGGDYLWYDDDVSLMVGDGSANKKQKNLLSQRNIGNSQFSQHFGQADNDPTDSTIGAKGSQSGKTFDIYWSHRLVPESKLTRLPFFPNEKWMSDHVDEVGPLCLNRLHGSLFFDWHFPISNNKLRLLPSYDSLGGDGMQGDDALSMLLHDEDVVTVKK